MSVVESPLLFGDADVACSPDLQIVCCLVISADSACSPDLQIVCLVISAELAYSPDLHTDCVLFGDQCRHGV